MTCKKCGDRMRLRLLRPAFKSFACATCDWVAVVRDDNPSPAERTAVSERSTRSTLNAAALSDRRLLGSDLRSVCSLFR
jgi:hypothetical protein